MLTFAPVVSRATTVFADVEVLRVVEAGVQAILDAIDNTRLQIDQQSTRNVMLIVSLIEEDIFTVVALRGVLFKDAFTTDAVLSAKLLPKLVSNYNTKKVNASLSFS